LNILGIIIISILASIPFVQATRSFVMQQSAHAMISRDLGIIPQIERKDTKMLCLEGCPLHGPDAWDIEHENRSAHDNVRCIRAAVSMVNSYFGGHLSQDRISYFVYAEYFSDELPENDLGHGKGVVNLNLVAVLRWALNGASVYRLNGKPGFDEIQYSIDSNRPIVRDHGENHLITVIDGYDTEGQLVHVIDPLTGTESKIAYEDLDVFVVWVPIGEIITARSDEPTIWMDSDRDGITDFEEANRFHTDPYNSDSDADGIDDKTEIRSYTFLSDDSFDLLDVINPDSDNDTLRAELDRDSDNGGCPDGFEDLNHNGKIDLGETDPYNPSDDPTLPVATFEFHPQNAKTKNQVIFNASQSYDPNGIIVSYAWNFGNGDTIKTDNPITNYTYSKPGNYTVTLNVTDNDGFYSIDSANITVTIQFDLNNDRKVDIKDIWIAAKAYGSRLGYPNWNEIADLNDDDAIDIIDIALLATEYGKIYS